MAPRSVTSPPSISITSFQRRALEQIYRNSSSNSPTPVRNSSPIPSDAVSAHRRNSEEIRQQLMERNRNRPVNEPNLGQPIPSTYQPRPSPRPGQPPPERLGAWGPTPIKTSKYDPYIPAPSATLPEASLPSKQPSGYLSPAQQSGRAPNSSPSSFRSRDSGRVPSLPRSSLRGVSNGALSGPAEQLGGEFARSLMLYGQMQDEVTKELDKKYGPGKYVPDYEPEEGDRDWHKRMGYPSLGDAWKDAGRTIGDWFGDLMNPNRYGDPTRQGPIPPSREAQTYPEGLYDVVIMTGQGQNLPLRWYNLPGPLWLGVTDTWGAGNDPKTDIYTFTAGGHGVTSGLGRRYNTTDGSDNPVPVLTAWPTGTGQPQSGPPQSGPRQAPSPIEDWGLPKPYIPPKPDPFIFDPQPQPQDQPQRNPDFSPHPAPYPLTPDELAPFPGRPTIPSPDPNPAPSPDPNPAPGRDPNPAPGRDPHPAPGISPSDSPGTSPSAPNRLPSLDPADTTQKSRDPRQSSQKTRDPNTGDFTKLDPPIQDPPPKVSPPEKCKDPCVQKLQDSVDEAKPTSITVKVFKSCDAKTQEAVFEEKTVSVPKAEAESYKLLYDRIANLEALQCNPAEAIALVPEWWQVRGSQKPQLIILFGTETRTGGKLTTSRWSLTVPHYNKPAGYKPKIPKYKRGNFEGILRLADNSRLSVNAVSSTECKRMINALKVLIDPTQLKGSDLKIGERFGSRYKEVEVVPIFAKFFSQGQKNATPEWTIKLRK